MDFENVIGGDTNISNGIHDLDKYFYVSHYEEPYFYLEIPTDNVLQEADSYITIVLVLIGLAGNSLTIVAVTSRHSKKTSFTVYLVTLAVVDTLALFSTTIQKWLFFLFKTSAFDISEFACKSGHYFEQLSPQISSWVVVSLTVERCLCVSMPHKTSLISRPKFSFIVVASITCILGALNAHFLYGFSLLPVQGEKDKCAYISNEYYSFHRYYWNWINIIVYCLLPFVIIVTANSITVTQVYRSSRLVTSTVSVNSSRRNRQLLLITLLVSFSFILLGMPQPFLDLLQFEDKNGTLDVEFLALKFGVLLSIFNHMKTLNHAVNFFLYILSGRKFRQDLKAAFIRCS